MSELIRRIRYLLNRGRLERELAEEMKIHRELMAESESPGNHPFGNPLRMMEDSREVWGWRRVDQLVQDLRYGLRVLRRAPGFAITAVLVLALGIGVNLTALRLLLVEITPTVREPDTLVQMTRRFPAGTGNTMAYPVLAFYAQHARSFHAVIVAHEDTVAFGATASGAEPENITVNFVTPNTFAEQLPPAALGRGLASPLDDSPDSEPVVVLNHRFWVNRLGGRADIIGQTVRLNGKTVRVAGIVRDPRQWRIDAWMPLAKQPSIVDGSKLTEDWLTSSSWGTARLNPGVTVRAAEEESRVLAAALRESHPEAVERDESLILTPFSSNKLHGQEAAAAAMGMALVMLILVVACANLGSLLLARGVSREREIRTRLALGAGRFRVVRQLLTESSLLAMVASLAAWFFSALALQLFLTEAGAPQDWAQAFDWRVMAGTAAISLSTVASFGLVPALRLTGGAPSAGRAHSVFLACQVGASCILLMVSGQLVRSFHQLLRQEPGFDYTQVLTISPGLHNHGYDNAAAKQYFDQLRQRVSSIPGVKRASLVRLRVWGNESSAFTDRGHRVFMNQVDGNFGATLGLHLSRGRFFAASERDVAVVSESFARWQWPGEDPLGKRLGNTQGNTGVATVVGVVAKAGTFDTQDADVMGIYYPLSDRDYRDSVLVVRVAGKPGQVAGTLVSAAAALDPKLRPDCSSLQKAFDTAVTQSRKLTTVLSLLGILATLLAAIGLAGLTGYTVSRRTREFGVRMALGAGSNRILLTVLRPLTVPVAAGILAGVMGAVAVSAVLRSNLSGLRPSDPLAYVTGSAVFLFVVVLAVSIPARRAIQTRPAEALRHE